MSHPVIYIGNRPVGLDYPPLVLAEIGINHEGCMDKAIQMIDDAAAVGCECVKFQCHVIDDEMIPEARNIIPGNASESIWEIMDRCAFSAEEENTLKTYVEERGMIYLSTPFSRAAALRLESMGVEAFKIGSGECNNYPLIATLASFGKPIILSTGMNDLASIEPAVDILRSNNIPFGLMHCTSIYPTPYNKVRLGAITQLADVYPDAVLGLSDHTMDHYCCLGAVALGASILERHFTSDKTWPGPDVPISMDPKELQALIKGSAAIWEARGGQKDILVEEQATIDFAYASVVSIRSIRVGEVFDEENVWVKRPGTGQVLAGDYAQVLGRKSTRDIQAHEQLRRSDIEPALDESRPNHA